MGWGSRGSRRKAPENLARGRGRSRIVWLVLIIPAERGPLHQIPDVLIEGKGGTSRGKEMPRGDLGKPRFHLSYHRQFVHTDKTWFNIDIYISVTEYHPSLQRTDRNHPFALNPLCLVSLRLSVNRERVQTGSSTYSKDQALHPHSIPHHSPVHQAMALHSHPTMVYSQPRPFCV